MNNDHKELKSDELHASMLESLRQNWENARYFEARRWNYIYFYYFAFGATIIYFASSFEECAYNFIQGSPSKFFFMSVVFCLLTLIGLAAFFHLSHANLEYKNFIKINQYLAEDLKLNYGFRDFRDNEKDNRTTYMALPLMLNLRGKVPAIKLSAGGVAFSTGITIFYLLLPIKLITSISITPLQILLIAGAISVAEFLYLCCWYKKSEEKAEEILKSRDPNNLKKEAVA